MAGVVIEHVPSVRGGHLANPVHLRSFQTIDGKSYFACRKMDSEIQRLLVGKSGKARMLANTDILEQIQEARNHEVDRLLAAQGPEDDLGLDDDRPQQKRSKTMPDSLPDYVTVQAPTIGDVEGISMKVLSGKYRDALWVELEASVIDYLAAAASVQITEGTIHRERSTNTTNEFNGISRDERRQGYRARRSDGHQRYFFDKKHEDARGDAREWRQQSIEEFQLQPVADDTHEPPMADMIPIQGVNSN